MCATESEKALLPLLKEMLMGRLREELEAKGTELAAKKPCHIQAESLRPKHREPYILYSSLLSNSRDQTSVSGLEMVLPAWSVGGRAEARRTDQLNRWWTGYCGESNTSWFRSSSMGKELGQESRAWVWSWT